MISLVNCPVCKSSTFSKKLLCKDYTVSGESFSIVSCNTCSFVFTNPRPEDLVLSNYYKSEDYISHSNTKKDLISRLYHLVRSYTVSKKLELVSTHVSRGTILDYGCGTGMFLKACQDKGWNVFGMEPDQGAALIAKKMGLNVACEKVGLDSDAKYDAITLWHVLEHVTDLDETLAFFNKRLSDKGALIIAVPNHTSYDAKCYGEYWAAYDVPRHLYHFDVVAMEKLLSRFGFCLKETRPMKFDSFYVSMLSEKYKTGTINYLKAFFVGLKSNFKAKSSTEYSSVIYVFKKG